MPNRSAQCQGRSFEGVRAVGIAGLSQAPGRGPAADQPGGRIAPAGAGLQHEPGAATEPQAGPPAGPQVQARPVRDWGAGPAQGQALPQAAAGRLEGQQRGDQGQGASR